MERKAIIGYEEGEARRCAIGIEIGSDERRDVWEHKDKYLIVK